MKRRPDHDLERRHGRRHGDPSHRSGNQNDFFGLDIEKMSPRVQVATSLAIIIPVALAGVFLFAFTHAWWIWFTFFWVIFPAFGMLVKGIAGLSEDSGELPAAPANSKERELLEALREHGELTPAWAAMETSLTVAEADRMLKELAEGGHLDVRVGVGGLFYCLWEPDSKGGTRGIEGQGLGVMRGGVRGIILYPMWVSG